MAEDVKVVKKVERSPKGLVDALFDSIDKLNAGLSTAEEARAVAHTARSIVGVARLELEAISLRQKLGSNIPISALPALGAGEEPKKLT